MPSYQGKDFFYDCSANDDISLDPRLVEYINKKKYFQEHNIHATTLDKEYGITGNDVMKIRSYLRGDQKRKKADDPEKYQDLVDPTEATFPSNELKDPRFERYKIKQQKNKDAKIQRHNYGVISGEYDMYRNDRPFASAYGDDFSKSAFHPQEWFQDSKPPGKKVSFHETNTYVNPKSTHNGYLARELSIEHDPYSVDAMIGKLDNYKHKVSQMRNPSEAFDTPKLTSNKKIMDNKQRNIDVDTYIKFGDTSTKSKTIGYPNPVEHYFGYISRDIQDPDHVVNPRAIPTRIRNKATARL